MPDPAAPLVLVLMGVSGCGKTTVGAMLAGRLGWEFAEGDAFHSPANVAKMRSGTPLDDADRAPWLASIAAEIDRWRSETRRGIVTCSALKRRYRDVLVGARADVGIVYLKGTQEVIADRLAARQGHYMPPSLLASQFAALEEPTADEHVLVVPIGRSVAAIVDEIVENLKLARP